MAWLDEALNLLDGGAPWGYHPGGQPYTEPTAWAALALSAHGRCRHLPRALAWLSEIQDDDGSVGVSAQQAAPSWPTSLAVLAWRAGLVMNGAGQGEALVRKSMSRGVQWVLNVKGDTPADPDKFIGHDLSLVGWPWMEGTHSWVEPTAMGLLALKANGLGKHPRAREAVRLLIDRLLPEGGCNYGGTLVLGRVLRPVVAPTGIAMMALAGEADPSRRVDKSLAYLGGALSERTTTLSLGFGLLGLAAHDRTPLAAGGWLEAAFARARERGGPPLELALLCLATLGKACPLVHRIRDGGPST